VVIGERVVGCLTWRRNYSDINSVGTLVIYDSVIIKCILMDKSKVKLETLLGLFVYGRGDVGGRRTVE